jgi:hypothetical protein
MTPAQPSLPTVCDCSLMTLQQEPFRWPRSAALWMAVAWLALFIIRPWEVMFPWLSGWSFERIYVLMTVSVVLATGKLRVRSSFQTIGLLVFFFTLLISSLCGMEPETTNDRIWIHLIHVAFFFFFSRRSGHAMTLFSNGSTLCMVGMSTREEQISVA